jgi:acetyl esterase/lipase
MKTFFLSLIPLQLLLLFTSCGQGMRNANNQNIKNKYLDIPYGNQSDAQKLDIYLPDSNLEKYPVIVSIHGGAFMMGDKADGQVNPMLQALNYGYAVVSVNYRLSGEAQFPAQIHDIKAAIRFIRANAAKYKLNSSKIAAWGGSAGGNLAALAGTSGNVTELEDLSQGNAEYSSRVQAVVDWFGPIDFCAMDQQFNESGKGKADHDAANSPESRLMGKPIQQIPELVKLANPETYITPDDPPFFIQHGTEDQLVPTQQSINFAAKLQNVLPGNQVTIELLQGAYHGGKEFDRPENVKKVIHFLDTYLK